MSYVNRGRGPSKASATTQCQKCLQRGPFTIATNGQSSHSFTGHYSYECKAAVQERPYQTRPSRSQQLLNPRLRQALTNQAPEEPTKGLADAILERSADERRSKRAAEHREGDTLSRKRSRSASSYDSVSTISTKRSRSRSPPRRAYHSVETGNGASDPRSLNGTKRRRSRSRSTSWDGPSRSSERNIRHRRRSSSPKPRGRQDIRSPSVARELPSYTHARSPRRSRERIDRDKTRNVAYKSARRTLERSPSSFSRRAELSRSGYS